MRDRMRFFCWRQALFLLVALPVSGDELLEVQLTAKIWTLFPNSDDVEGNLTLVAHRFYSI